MILIYVSHFYRHFVVKNIIDNDNKSVLIAIILHVSKSSVCLDIKLRVFLPQENKLKTNYIV